MKKISRRSEQAHSKIRLVGTCRKVPLVYFTIAGVKKMVRSLINKHLNLTLRHDNRQTGRITTPRRSYLGQFFLGMCRWPLRAPKPLQSVLWPIIGPISVNLGQKCNFCDPNLVTFYLCIYTLHQQYKHSGTFAN